MALGYPGGEVGVPGDNGDIGPGEGNCAHLTCWGVDGVGEGVGDGLPVGGGEEGGATDGGGLP